MYIETRERRLSLRFFDFDPDGDDLSLVAGRKEERTERTEIETKVREIEKEKGERDVEKRRKGGRECTHDPEPNRRGT